ncbi:MAG: dihydroneopterin aldolase [Acidimicrobiia bacterium]
MNQDAIKIAAIEVFAFHGVMDEEKEKGQRFLIDLEMRFDLSAAAASDRLDETVDYGVMATKVHDLVASARWDLIETVAERVAESVLAEPRIESVIVTVHKPEAPISVGFRDLSVTIERGRE